MEYLFRWTFGLMFMALGVLVFVFCAVTIIAGIKAMCRDEDEW